MPLVPDNVLRVVLVDVLEDVPAAVLEVLEAVPEVVPLVVLDVVLEEVLPVVAVLRLLTSFIFTMLLLVPVEERVERVEEADEPVLVREAEPVKDVLVLETLLVFVLGVVLLD
ncbi:MAG: hypothetical protein LIO44_05905 [Eubacterium sp.]|nr:hypothetical protein [Eubacterium sp.]